MKKNLLITSVSLCSAAGVALAAAQINAPAAPVAPQSSDNKTVAAKPSLPNMAAQKPNIVLIYADDIGYGDVGSYGAKVIATPNVDRLTRQGLKFTDAHCTSATCTPSRYSLLTGEYAFRQKGTGILRGDAPLIIQPSRQTLASMLQGAGYNTGLVGKWHLGLGGAGGPDWNGQIKPGPREVGFDYSFFFPATSDRVPTVYVRNDRVVNLDPNDPIKVDYKNPVDDGPTGAKNPELLKMKPSHGHNNTIVNGISRIGWMSGGKTALWKDEDLATTFTSEAQKFIERQSPQKPFFLYFATHNNHVPRAPDPRFVGKTPLGARGDAVVEFDWMVGQVLDTLDRLKLSRNTLVILSSDNGPVLDDGYQDGAVALNRKYDHKPAGPFRGGKNDVTEGGTRVPFIVRWPGQVRAGRVSNALVSQVDLLASLAALTGQPFDASRAPDSSNQLAALLGLDPKGRDELTELSFRQVIGLRSGSWKFIPGGNGPQTQLYDLSTDVGETRNLAASNPAKTAELQARLEEIASAE